MALINFEFNPNDKGLSAFIEKIKKQLEGLKKASIDANASQNTYTGSNPQLIALNAQLEAIRKKTLAQRELLDLLTREDRILNHNGTRDQTQIRQANVRSAALNERVAASHVQATQVQKKIKKVEDEDKKKPESIFGALVLSNLVKDLGKLVSSAPSAKNDISLIKPIASLIGTAVGGIAGSVVGLIPGLGGAGAIGAELGAKAGDFVATAAERTSNNRNELQRANFGLQAMTGRDQGVSGQNTMAGIMSLKEFKLGNDNRNLSKLGLDFVQSAQLLQQVAKAQGSGKDMGTRGMEVASLKNAFGVENSQAFGLLELKKENSKAQSNLTNIVGGLLNAGKNSTFAGGDKTQLPQVIQRFTELQKEALEGQVSVGEKTVSNLMFAFNKIGPQYNVNDPRSAKNISTLDNSIKNASGGGGALLISELQRLNPNMSATQLQEEKQKGIFSKANRMAIRNLAKNYGGGSEEAEIQFIAANFTGGSIKEARALKNGGLDRLANTKNGNQLSGGKWNDDSVYNQAKKQTSVIDKNQADISNEFTKSIEAGIKKVGDDIVNLFGIMLVGATERVKEILNEAGKTKYNSDTTGLAFRRNKSKDGKHWVEKSVSEKASESLNNFVQVETLGLAPKIN